MPQQQALPMGTVKYTDDENDPILAWRKKLQNRNQIAQTAQQDQQVSPLAQGPQQEDYAQRRQGTIQTGQTALQATQQVQADAKARQIAIRQRKYQEQLAFSQSEAARKTQYELKKQSWAAYKQSQAQQRQYADYLKQIQNGQYGYSTQNVSNGAAPQGAQQAQGAQQGGYQLTGQFGNAGLGGERESNAQAIAAEALRRGLGRDGVIAGIMTAMTESSLTNVGHGDAMGPSSRGLFQQMPKYWGPESTIMDPTGAAGLFFDKWTSTSGTPWQRAQAVQQSEFSDGSNYQKNYQAAVEIADKLLGGGIKTQALKPVASAPYSISSADGKLRTAVVQNAQHAIGLPYVWGGASLSSGADCSGLVEALYGQLGIDIPEVSPGGGGRAQSQVTGLTSAKSGIRGTRTSVNNLQPGDLVAWQGGWAGPDYVGHIAVYVGNGQIIESPDVGMTVRQRALRSNENTFGVHLTF